eukprot:4299800-Amphidinium_carterae.1
MADYLIPRSWQIEKLWKRPLQKELASSPNGLAILLLVERAQRKRAPCGSKYVHVLHAACYHSKYNYAICPESIKACHEQPLLNNNLIPAKGIANIIPPTKLYL